MIMIHRISNWFTKNKNEKQNLKLSTVSKFPKCIYLFPPVPYTFIKWPKLAHVMLLFHKTLHGILQVFSTCIIWEYM